MGEVVRLRMGQESTAWRRVRYDTREYEVSDDVSEPGVLYVRRVTPMADAMYAGGKVRVRSDEERGDASDHLYEMSLLTWEGEEKTAGWGTTIDGAVRSVMDELQRRENRTTAEEACAKMQEWLKEGRR